MKTNPKNKTAPASTPPPTPALPVEAGTKKPARPPLPLMGSFDDAEALAMSQKDPFYLAAFLSQLWLSELSRRAETATPYLMLRRAVLARTRISGRATKSS